MLTARSRSSPIADWTKKVVVSVGGISCVAIIFLVLMTVYDVAMRTFFNKPMMGSQEYTQYLMVIIAFCAMAWRVFEGGHVSVEILVDRLSRRTQVYFDLFNHAIVLFLSALIAWNSVAESMNTYRFGQRSSITDIPQWPFYLVVTTGYTLIFLAVAVKTAESIREAVKK